MIGTPAWPARSSGPDDKSGEVYGPPRVLHTLREEPGRYLAFLGRISPEKRVDRAIRIARAAGLPLRIAAKVDAVDRECFEARFTESRMAADYVRLYEGLLRPRSWQPAVRPDGALFDASLYVDLHGLPELFCGFVMRPGEGPTLSRSRVRRRRGWPAHPSS